MNNCIRETLIGLHTLKQNKELILSYENAKGICTLSDGSKLELDWGICIYMEERGIAGNFKYWLDDSTKYNRDTPIQPDEGYSKFENIYHNPERWEYIDWVIEQLEAKSKVDNK